MTGERTLKVIGGIGSAALCLANPGGLFRWMGSGLALDPVCRFYLITENWKVYLPPGGVKGKVVMDIGAGCGESVWLYFKNGASKVIAIEPNRDRTAMIRENAEAHGWNLELRERKFQLEDLDEYRDFTKVNIEGYEALLLDKPNKLGPMVLDAHNWYMVERFRRIGFHCITKPSKMLGQCYMANY